MSDRFYTEQLLGLGDALLEGAEAHHLAHVRRLEAGERITLFNGNGKTYLAVIESIGKRSVQLRVERVEAPQMELGFRLEIASALPKGDRLDYLIEKLTELGVTDFVPLQTARSIVHPKEARLDKLRRAVIESSKQCGRNVLMRVQAPVRWAEYCRQATLPQQRFLAHPGGEMIGKECPSARDAVLAIGPEGGFTDEEVEEAREAGWRVVGLGPRILRIETAAVVLAARATFNNPAA
jgi:16S rRNA (uracil1498-N3)-methyltransferase